MFAVRRLSTVNKGIIKRLRTSSIGIELLGDEVRSLLRNAGYRNLYSSEDHIADVFVSSTQSSSKYDAIVTGSKHNFESFCDLFKTSYKPYLPNRMIM